MKAINLWYPHSLKLPFLYPVSIFIYQFRFTTSTCFVLSFGSIKSATLFNLLVLSWWPTCAYQGVKMEHSNKSKLEKIFTDLVTANENSLIKYHTCENGQLVSFYEISENMLWQLGREVLANNKSWPNFVFSNFILYKCHLNRLVPKHRLTISEYHL